MPLRLRRAGGSIHAGLTEGRLAFGGEGRVAGQALVEARLRAAETVAGEDEIAGFGEQREEACKLVLRELPVGAR